MPSHSDDAHARALRPVRGGGARLLLCAVAVLLVALLVTRLLPRSAPSIDVAPRTPPRAGAPLATRDGLEPSFAELARDDVHAPAAVDVDSRRDMGGPDTGRAEGRVVWRALAASGPARDEVGASGRLVFRVSGLADGSVYGPGGRTDASAARDVVVPFERGRFELPAPLPGARLELVAAAVASAEGRLAAARLLAEVVVCDAVSPVEVVLGPFDGRRVRLVDASSGMPLVEHAVFRVARLGQPLAAEFDADTSTWSVSCGSEVGEFLVDVAGWRIEADQLVPFGVDAVQDLLAWPRHTLELSVAGARAGDAYGVSVQPVGPSHADQLPPSFDFLARFAGADLAGAPQRFEVALGTRAIDVCVEGTVAVAGIDGAANEAVVVRRVRVEHQPGRVVPIDLARGVFALTGHGTLSVVAIADASGGDLPREFDLHVSGGGSRLSNARLDFVRVRAGDADAAGRIGTAPLVLPAGPCLVDGLGAASATLVEVVDGGQHTVEVALRPRARLEVALPQAMGEELTERTEIAVRGDALCRFVHDVHRGVHVADVWQGAIDIEVRRFEPDGSTRRELHAFVVEHAFARVELGPSTLEAPLRTIVLAAWRGGAIPINEYAHRDVVVFEPGGTRPLRVLPRRNGIVNVRTHAPAVVVAPRHVAGREAVLPCLAWFDADGVAHVVRRPAPWGGETP